MRVRSLPVVVLTAACVLSAADYWIAKPSGQWTAQEIQRMVTDSPWARPANVTSDAGATPNITVRWESAVPICDACTKGGLEPHLFSCASKLLYLSGMANKFAEFSREFYIVSMSNYPKTGSDDALQHSAAANATLERAGQRIQQGASLSRKNKAAMKPDHVLVVPTGRTWLVMLFFPRSQALAVDDQEIVFESADGGLRVRSKFDLRKMMFQGSLAL